MLLDILNQIDSIVWGPWLLVLLVGTGIWLTFRLTLLQVVKLPRALKLIFFARNKGEGDIDSFKALCTALAATVGTGNIGFLHRTALVRLGDCILHGLGKFLYLDFHKIVLHYVFD